MSVDYDLYVHIVTYYFIIVTYFGFGRLYVRAKALSACVGARKCPYLPRSHQKCTPLRLKRVVRGIISATKLEPCLG